MAIWIVNGLWPPLPHKSQPVLRNIFGEKERKEGAQILEYNNRFVDHNPNARNI